MQLHLRKHLEGISLHAVIGMAGQDWQPIWEPRPDDPIFPQPDRSMYHGGEFKEKLTLITYVGNQDGQMHDMVEILASGEVLSGGDSISKEAGDRIKVIDSTFPWYVKPGCSSLGLFFGLYFRLRFPFQEAKW